MKKLPILIVMILAGSAGSFAQYRDHRNRQVDSLEQVLATNPPTGMDLAVIYRELMRGYEQTDVEKSMKYARKCVEVSISAEGWRTANEGYVLWGVGYGKLSQYDRAQECFDKALEMIERMKESGKYDEDALDDACTVTYGNLANHYNMQGLYHEAVRYYIEVLRIMEKYPDETHIVALVHENLGEMYRSMGNDKQAEENYAKMDSLAHTLNDSLFIARAKQKLAFLHLDRKEYDPALEDARIAYGYFFAHPEEGEERAVMLNLLAQIHLDGYGDLSQAENYVGQALALAEEYGILYEIAVSKAIIAAIHLNRGEWRAAERAALEALSADEIEPESTLSLYEILSKAYSRLGDSNKTWEYLDKHNKLQHSWANRNYQSAIREMETRYETEKKETRIATLEEERRLIVWLTVAGGVVLLLALAALFFLWRWSVGRRRIVATQALLDGETAERTRLARDLHDGLGSMLTGIKLSLENLRNEGTSDVAPSLDMLGESMKELRRISHHLMPDALQNEGLKPALAAFCKSMPGVQFGWFGTDERTDPQMEVIIYRIIHELVNNALKHSGASQTGVQVMREADYIAFTVRDNGCGFDPAEAEKRGMGLRNIRDRVTSGGGRILVDSVPGEGTEININFKTK